LQLGVEPETKIFSVVKDTENSEMTLGARTVSDTVYLCPT
jgi:hypothetical protein